MLIKQLVEEKIILVWDNVGWEDLVICWNEVRRLEQG